MRDIKVAYSEFHKHLEISRLPTHVKKMLSKSVERNYNPDNECSRFFKAFMKLSFRQKTAVLTFPIVKMLELYINEILYCKSVCIDHSISGFLWQMNDPVMSIVDRMKDFKEAEHQLVLHSILDQHRRYIICRRLENKKVLLGVMLYLFEKKYFVPFFTNQQGKREKVTSKVILDRLCKRYSVSRMDQIRDEPQLLINRALKRVPQIAFLEQNKQRNN